MKFIIVIQARLSSKRLPRKVIASLNYELEKPVVLEHLLQRISKVNQIDEVIIAVPETELLIFKNMLFLKNNYLVGGATYDVLSRFIKATQGAHNDDYIIRITADNPFIDYLVLEKNISFVKKEIPDYSYPAWLPLGMSFEICKLDILKNIHKLDLSSFHREHVTTYIKENSERYIIKPMKLETSKYPFYEKLRLTIDQPDDLHIARKLYAYFKNNDEYFSANEVNQLYQKKPKFFSENSHIKQNIPWKVVNF